MRTIRKSVWETNSSSVHSLVVNKEDFLNEILPKKIDLEKERKRIEELLSGEYTVFLGEYGWGYDFLNSFSDKLDYICTELAYCSGEKTKEGILEYMEDEGFLNFLKINFNIEKLDIQNLESFYIDHQSVETIKWVLDGEYNSKEMLRFLLDDSISIEISNDNTDYGVYNGYVEINNLRGYFEKDLESVELLENEDETTT